MTTTEKIITIALALFLAASAGAFLAAAGVVTL